MSGQSLGSPRVLIVENERIIAESIKRTILRIQNFTIKIVDSVEEVIRQLRKEPPDLIILDMAIDGNLESIRLIRRIRSFSDASFILIDSQLSPPYLDLMQANGRIEYLLKPFDFAQLRTTVQRMPKDILHGMAKGETSRENHDSLEVSKIELPLNLKVCQD